MDIKPELLQWACRRGQVDPGKLRKRFPKYDDWKSGKREPTLRQVKDFAKFTHVPVGALFLSNPMKETLPIKDLRTIGDKHISDPSANLLDTVYLCQRRQNWYRRFALSEGEDSLSFVGSATVKNDIESTAKEIQTTLNFDLQTRQNLSNWSDVFRHFVDQADIAGLLVMISGSVGNNPNRKLDPKEFRGFALADDYAPLVFINGADTKAAQIFTLAHELAHIWLGESSLSNTAPDLFPSHIIEKWCNQVASELLVPSESLHEIFRTQPDISDEIQRLARQYKVSSLVILRRLLDIGKIQHKIFVEQYKHLLGQLKTKAKGKGGNFHATLKNRVGHRFGSALVASTLSGETPYTHALRYLGIRKISTLDTFAKTLREENKN